MNKTEAFALLNNKVEQGVVAVFMPNDNTGGQSCIFKMGNKYYYADKSYCLDVGMQETMIFPYDKDKEEVSDWSELYCDRTGKSLSACIEEFNQMLLIKQQQSC